MGEFLSTLPGDILGLLRRGSPVIIDFYRSEGHDNFPDDDDRPEDYICRGVVYEVEGDALYVAWSQSEAHEGGADEIHRDWMALDLTDLTGRCHAAVWVYLSGRGREDDGWRLMEKALHHEDMTVEEIDTLARLVLRLAGRSHA